MEVEVEEVDEPAVPLPMVARALSGEGWGTEGEGQGGRDLGVSSTSSVAVVVVESGKGGPETGTGDLETGTSGKGSVSSRCCGCGLAGRATRLSVASPANVSAIGVDSGEVVDFLSISPLLSFSTSSSVLRKLVDVDGETESESEGSEGVSWVGGVAGAEDVEGRGGGSMS